MRVIIERRKRYSFRKLWHNLWILDFSPVIEVLLYIRESNWILNSSSVLKYLTIISRIMFPVFSHPSNLESLERTLELCWKGVYQVLISTQTAVKLQSLEPCVHLSQLKGAPPDSWSCIASRDLILKLSRKILPQKQMASWGTQLSQDHRAKLSSSIWNLYFFCRSSTCLFSLLMLGKTMHLNSGNCYWIYW